MIRKTMMAALFIVVGVTFLLPVSSLGSDRPNQSPTDVDISARILHLQAVDDGSPMQTALSPSDCCIVPGDANHDGECNVADAVRLVCWIFGMCEPPPCMGEGDVNADCAVNIGDAVYLINYIFKNAPPPVCGCVPSLQ